jgi:hypothetical protein
VGPITIFDKSAFQALSVDEAVWFDTFYLANITPLFFVETLADLEKADAKGRPPERVVGGLAGKTPLGGHLNVHHGTLCLGELLGYPVEMRGVPVIGGGQPVATQHQMGLKFEPPPEEEAFQRWQRHEFLDVERLFARRWRQALSGIDFTAVYEKCRPAPGARLRDLHAAKLEAERRVRHDGRRYAMLKWAMASIGAPPELRRQIVARWKSLGGPVLWDFAPYTAHVITVDAFFNLALGSDLIGRERPSNKVDLAYLYYLPFCNVFVSNDRLHRRCVPCFLTEHHAVVAGREVSVRQEFITGDDLKADLAKLDAHYSALPEEVRARGVMAFAHHPPPDGDFLVTRLWDRFLPKWRENIAREPLGPEAHAKVLEHMKGMKQARPVGGEAARNVDAQSAGFVMFERRVPARRGKWRLLPPEACE